MISTRNIDTKTEYKLIRKYVEGIAPYSAGRSLEEAIDIAVKQFPDGEFLKNVKIYTRNYGRRVKVVGDVWGIPSNSNPQVNNNVLADSSNGFAIGEKVSFINNNKYYEGVIEKLHKKYATVQTVGLGGINIKFDIYYTEIKKLTQINN